MTQERIQRAVADDGTEIAGRVHGRGPSVVFVHGSAADGDSEWSALVPWLTDRFTCYLPSTRGRGLSGAHPDVSRETRVNDTTAFVESIGEPVGLVGVSAGAILALGAAARTQSVRAVVTREPVVIEVMSDDLRGRFGDIVEFVADALSAGRVAEAAEAFVGFIANDEEAAALSQDDEGLHALAEYLPIDVVELREMLDGDRPSPTDPSVLQRITVPTLLLHGTHTARSWFTDGTRYVGEHVPDATVREIPGTGHLGHLLHPERDATELIPFLEAAHQAV